MKGLLQCNTIITRDIWLEISEGVAAKSSVEDGISVCRILAQPYLVSRGLNTYLTTEYGKYPDNSSDGVRSGFSFRFHTEYTSHWYK